MPDHFLRIWLLSHHYVTKSQTSLTYHRHCVFLFHQKRKFHTHLTPQRKMYLCFFLSNEKIKQNSNSFKKKYMCMYVKSLLPSLAMAISNIHKIKYIYYFCRIITLLPIHTIFILNTEWWLSKYNLTSGCGVGGGILKLNVTKNKIG